MMRQIESKYKKGQVVVLKSVKKELPFRILDVYQDDDGEWFYFWDKKNAAHEGMLRSLTPQEIGIV